MTKKPDNKSALSGMMSGARQAKSEKEAAEKIEASKPAGPTKKTPTKSEPSTKAPTGEVARERFSVYADRATFERVKAWATFMKVSQADVIERAINLYADRLGEEFNNGKDPHTLKEAPTELP